MAIAGFVKLEVIATRNYRNAELEKQLSFLEIIDVQSGSGFTLFLTNNGEVYGAGKSAWGQLGVIADGDQNFSKLPITNVKAMTTCDEGAAFLTVYDDVYVCGFNWDLRFGFSCGKQKLTMEKHQKMSKRGVRLLAGGSAHVVFVLKDNTVWIGGNNTSGFNFDITQTVEYTWFRNRHHVVSKVACGSGHTAFLTNAGKLIITSKSPLATHQKIFDSAERGLQFTGEVAIPNGQRCIDLALNSSFSMVLTNYNNLYLYHTDGNLSQVVYNPNQGIFGLTSIPKSASTTSTNNSNLPTITRLLCNSKNFGFITSDHKVYMDTTFSSEEMFNAKGTLFEFNYASAVAEGEEFRQGGSHSVLLHASFNNFFATFVVGIKPEALFFKKAPHKKVMASELSSFLTVLQDVTIITQQHYGQV